MSQSTVA